MKKTILLVIALMLILTGCNSTSTDADNYYYSKKLVSAIKEEDIVAIEAIIEENPDCINTGTQGDGSTVLRKLERT